MFAAFFIRSTPPPRHDLYSGHQLRFGIAGRPVGVPLNCAPHKIIHRIKVRGVGLPKVGAGVPVEIGIEPSACFYGRMARCRILLPNVRPPIGHGIVFTMFSEHIAAFRISAFVWPARTIITHVTRLCNSLYIYGARHFSHLFAQLLAIEWHINHFDTSTQPWDINPKTRYQIYLEHPVQDLLRRTGRCRGRC